MAKPRIFVSSTYYDLKHVRSSLDIFIESLGYDSVLSEKGDIAYSPDTPLDESCYREVSNADVFVLIIGGRYGSESNNGDKKKDKGFYTRYESVTKKEFGEAIGRDIPTYVLVEQSVYSEYHTYLRNKDNKDVSYAHVDSVNIFKFIEEVLSRPRNNPTQTFEKFSDIASWLREQWAGLFRELLKRMSEQKKFAELSQQVEGLREINNTLKTYLESVMRGESPEDSSKLIETEAKRLREREKNEKIRQNHFYQHISANMTVDLNEFISAVRKSKTLQGFAKIISGCTLLPDAESKLIELFDSAPEAIEDLNQIRNNLDLPIFRKTRRPASDKLK